MADDVIWAGRRKQLDDQIEEGIKPVRTGRVLLVMLAFTVAITILDVHARAWAGAAVYGGFSLVQCFLIAKFIRNTQRHAYMCGWQDGLEELRRKLDE